MSISKSSVNTYITCDYPGCCNKEIWPDIDEDAEFHVKVAAANNRWDVFGYHLKAHADYCQTHASLTKSPEEDAE